METNVTHFPVLIPDGHRGERGLPSPKANTHPYAIKTTSTALLSRSNSNSQSSHSSHFYIPPSPRHDSDLRHRHTKSETSIEIDSSKSPRPLPIPPISKRSDDIVKPLHSPSRSLSPDRINQINTFSPTKVIDLPLDPRTWTPGELAEYLIEALPVARLVAGDIAGFIKANHMSGRTFLRINESDLNKLNLNNSWRRILLDASNVLRQNTLKGRIWGFGEAETRSLERLSYANSSSSSLDLPSTLMNTPSNGHVRGIVASYEKERSSSLSSASESDADDDVFGSANTPDRHARRRIVRPLGSEEYIESPVSSECSGLSNAFTPSTSFENEPSVEELLALSSKSEDLVNSWGAKAWEELDNKACAKVTMKWIGSESNSPSKKVQDNSMFTENHQYTPEVEIASSTYSTPSPLKSIQKDIKSVLDAENFDAIALEAQVLENRRLAETLRRRLEELEHNLAGMERKSNPEARRSESRETQTNSSTATTEDCKAKHDISVQLDVGLIEAGSDSSENINSTSIYNDQSSIFSNPLQYWRDSTNLNPSEWDPLDGGLPSYILMVGFGLCTVVIQSMLKRWAYQKP